MISNPDFQNILQQRGIDESQYRWLVDHGKRHGRLTRDEVIDVIPDVEFDEPLIQQFFNALGSAGIEVERDGALDLPEYGAALDDDDDEDPGRDGDGVTTATRSGGIAIRGDAVAMAVEDDEDPLLAAPDLSAVEVDDVLRIYLREAASVPLLTQDEEVDLARRIELCRSAYEELGKGNVSTRRQTELNRIIEDGRKAREHLIRANTRLVISIARRYNGRGLSISDLIQEGNIGLMRAIRHYEYQRGFKFSTYATWWIRQAISRALADQSRMIRLPAYMSDQMTRLRRVQLELQQRFGRLPNVAELAEGMNMSPDKIQAMLESMNQPLSLEAPVSVESDGELGDMLEDVNSPNPEELVMDRMDGEEMRRRLALLPEREIEIITMRYGLGEEEALTLAEVGKRLGITRERARQLELQALQRLRNPETAQRPRRGPRPRERTQRPTAE